MLLSIALILLTGMILGHLCRIIKLPSLIGMLIAGIVIGPHVLDLLDGNILAISADIRKIALIIILTRAGLSLDISELKQIGRPALLMCFIPATCEIVGMLVVGPQLLGLTLLESAVTGAVLAAVSPAVVVPRMVKLIDEGYGTKQGIPQIILAGASVDDIYVIVLFTAFVGMLKGDGVSVMSFVNIPVSIIAGIIIGIIVGTALSWLWRKASMRSTVKVIATLAISLALSAIEDKMTTAITFSSLIAIMFIGIAIKKNSNEIAKELSGVYNKLWIGGEIFLFVLVGATVDISYLSKVGISALVVIVCALAFRMIGVFMCLIGTKLNRGERLFTMMAYCPKATVQAAIGGVPLAYGLACGDTTLTVAVLAIVVTAPLGALAIDSTYRKLLKKA